MGDDNFKKLVGLAKKLTTTHRSPMDNVYPEEEENIWGEYGGHNGPYHQSQGPYYDPPDYGYGPYAELYDYEQFDDAYYDETPGEVDLTNNTIQRQKEHEMSPSAKSDETGDDSEIPQEKSGSDGKDPAPPVSPVKDETTLDINCDEIMDKFEKKVKKQGLKGDDLNPRFAGLANTMWNGAKEASTVSAILKKYPCPGNLQVEMVEINPEIEPPPYHLGKKRDNSLKQVQGAIARSSYPLMKLTEAVLQRETDPEKLTDLCYDTLALLADANAKVLKVRRENLKAQVHPGYKSICSITPQTDVSKWLFGPRLDQRIKGSVDGSKIRRRGTPRFHPYGRSRGYGESDNVQSYINPYQGEKYLGFDSTCGMHDDNETICLDFRPKQRVEHVEPSPPSSTRQRPKLPEDLNDVSALGYSDKWGDKFEAGRVSLSVDKWAELTSDHEILSDIRGYKLKLLKTPSQERPMPEIKFSPEEKQLVRAEINKLIENKVIVQVQHVEGEFVSNDFCREKKNKDKKRTILNLKNLNNFLVKTKFKMDTLMTTLALVTPGCFFNSFDFKDAYFSCAVFKPHRRFLRFQFDGKLFEFCVLPQGMSDAPRFYTKIMKVPLAKLREMGITISGYLDDQIHINYVSRETAIAEGVIAADLFQDTGNTISWDKSVVDGRQEIEHLGFVINSITMLVTMSTEKVEKILGLVRTVVNMEKISIRVLAKLIGKIVATLPGNKYAKLMSANMEILKNDALFRNNFDYDGSVVLNKFVKSDLMWIIEELPQANAPVRYSEPDYVISTDASDQGFGMYDPQIDVSSRGRWGFDEYFLHINTLEVLGCMHGLLSLTRDKKDIHVRIMTDSTTALSCINKFGTTRSKRRNKIVRDIWDYARSKNIWISACFIAGKENNEADKASREFDDTT